MIKMQLTPSKKFISVSFLILSSLLLISCSGKQKYKEHQSSSGEILEKFIPSDVSLVFSYSLRNESQLENMTNLQANLGEDEALANLLQDQVDSKFQEAGLTYSFENLFGANPRLLLATRGEAESMDRFLLITSENPEALETAFDEWVASGDLESKTIGKIQAYVNEENAYYVALHEDILLMGSRPEALIEMLETKSNLWESELYQKRLSDIGSEYLFYGILFPANLSDGSATNSQLYAFGSATESQTLRAIAMEDGIKVDVYMDNLEENSIAIPQAKAYLYKDFPSDDLLAYVESYGLKQSLEAAEALPSANLDLEAAETFFRTYFAMGFKEDFLSFFQEAYAISLHKNGDGLVPGLSILTDLGDEEKKAEDFISKIDSQVTQFLPILELALPGAVKKTTVQIGGNDFSTLEINLKTLAETQGALSGASSLPESIRNNPILLTYGILDGNLLLTTANIWSRESFVSMQDDQLVKDLQAKIKGADEGLMFLNSINALEYMTSIRALREQLNLGVAVEGVQFTDILKPFTGALASGEKKGKRTHFSGYLLMNVK